MPTDAIHEPVRPPPGPAPRAVTSGRAPGEPALPPEPSSALFRLFSGYARRYVCRHFHAVRLSGDLPTVTGGAAAAGPIVVYLNHPSWWDPLTCLTLASRFFPGRRHYAPIDARALERYKFFRRLGFFGVEVGGTYRGAAQFLRAGLAVLARADAVLWVTAEGAFRDPRQRPVQLQPGLARLLCRAGERGGDPLVLPLAVEYPFWQERTPEMLARFGVAARASQIGGAPQASRSSAALQGELQRRLEDAMDRLGADAIRQDPAAFHTILGGRAGVGGVYDLWRRAVALVRRERFVPEHGANP